MDSLTYYMVSATNNVTDLGFKGDSDTYTLVSVNSNLFCLDHANKSVKVWMITDTPIPIDGVLATPVDLFTSLGEELNPILTFQCIDTLLSHSHMMVISQPLTFQIDKNSWTLVSKEALRNHKFIYILGITEDGIEQFHGDAVALHTYLDKHDNIRIIISNNLIE